MTEIQKFDPSLLMQGVKDRIKATFVSLIPEDHWENLCKKEVDEFFRIKDREYRYKNESSDFQIICREVLRELSKAKIIEFLKEYDKTIYKDGELMLSDKLKELIVNHASEIFTASIGSMFQNAISRMKQY